MTFLSRITSMFRRAPDAPTAVRNRAGGMAWIKGISDGYGAEALNARAVKTVRLGPDGKWEIEPQQQFVVTRDTLFISTGLLLCAGDQPIVCGIADACLEPWRDTGLTREEVAELYAQGERTMA